MVLSGSALAKTHGGGGQAWRAGPRTVTYYLRGALGFFTFGGSVLTWVSARSTHRAATSGVARQALGRAERARSVDALQFGTALVVEPHAHGGAEQPGEHVPVHERAEVAEHRLDLDRRVVRQHGPEEVLVRLTRLGYFHGLLPRAPGRRQAGTGAWKMLNAAPCGSVTTAILPIGVSNGSTMTEPPSSLILAAVASASSTAKYTCQWLGTPAICGGVVPPTSLPPTWNIVYLSPSISAVAVPSPSTCS